MADTTIRTRIAPSPTGNPHIGNMYVALVDWAWAHQNGGEFIVRIEDTDRTRYVEGAEQMFLDALKWLGLDYDEGPDAEGEAGPYRQSERLDVYQDHAQRLIGSGHAYRCFCSPERLAEVRAERQAAGRPTGYDGRCRDLPEEEVHRRMEEMESYTVRLRSPDEGKTTFDDALRGEIEFENETIGDQVLLKSDGYPTYHLASVVDDHLMGVTAVIRAEEWITSTPKHVLLYEAFGWEQPAFYHLPLIRNPDRSKLSKRKNPTNVLWYRSEGYLPEAIVNFLGLLGHSMPDEREIFTLDEFRREFSWDRVTTGGPVFDMDKFEWLNGMWIRRLSPDELAGRLEAEGFMPEGLPEENRTAIVVLVQERIRKLSEFAEAVGFFVRPEPYAAELLIPTKGKKKKPTRTGAETLAALEELRATLGDLKPWHGEAMEAMLREMAEEKGWKAGELFKPLRVAITCRQVSTPLFETMEILGKPECLARMDTAIERAGKLV